MARRCDLCGKKAVAGHNVSYSKRRTARRFMPNLRFITLGGQRIKTCMKCLKKLKNDGKITQKRSASSFAKASKDKEIVKIEPEVKKEEVKKTPKPKTLKPKKTKAAKKV